MVQVNEVLVENTPPVARTATKFCRQNRDYLLSPLRRNETYVKLLLSDSMFIFK